MKTLLLRADGLTPLALKLVAAANVLLFILFLATLVLVGGEAGAEEKPSSPVLPACTGQDLMAEIAAEDPALAHKVEVDAAATLNGRGLLWKLEKDGVAPSYLFGTMHMTDERVTGLTPAAQGAFEASKTVVIETTDVLDQAKMMQSMTADPDLMMFTDATTLKSLMTPEQIELVEAGLKKRGIPLSSVNKMKPWMLSAMVALPACELARKNSGAQILDIKLAADAEKAGKKIAGLETMASQLRAMASLPMQFHIDGLVETIRLGDRMDDVIETMIVLYEREETGMFWPLFRAVLPSAGEDAPGYAAFEEAMVTGRNKTMADRAVPILRTGGAFIAVGALHLPGPDGLVERFRRAGYAVTPAG